MSILCTLRVATSCTVKWRGTRWTYRMSPPLAGTPCSASSLLLQSTSHNSPRSPRGPRPSAPPLGAGERLLPPRQPPRLSPARSKVAACGRPPRMTSPSERRQAAWSRHCRMLCLLGGHPRTLPACRAIFEGFADGSSDNLLTSGRSRLGFKTQGISSSQRGVGGRLPRQQV